MATVTRDVMEDRIKRMLEMERLAGDVQAQLRQSQSRTLPMPAMAEDLLDELDNLDGPENHPDFVEFVMGEPLIEREGFAVDKYRSLRFRMGSEGLCCHRRHLHAVLADVEDGDDLPLVRKAMQTAFHRHMRFSTSTAMAIVKACSRGGSALSAMDFVSPNNCDGWRLPVDGAVLNQLMLEVAVSGDEAAMNTVLESLLAAKHAEHKLSTRALFYFTKGMATAGNIESVMRAVLLSRNSATGKVHDSIWNAAAPCLAELGGDLAPESAAAKKRAWRVFGLLAGACALQASSQGLEHAVFATNPRRRAIARAEHPDAVSATNLPHRLAEAFDAMSSLEPPAALAALFEREAALANASDVPATEAAMVDEGEAGAGGRGEATAGGLEAEADCDNDNEQEGEQASGEGGEAAAEGQGDRVA